MATGIRSGLRGRFGVARAALGNPGLVRLLASWGGWTTAEWGLLVALSVVAFDRGGPVAVGLVGVVQVLPGALLGPLTGVVADRRSRPRVLAVVHGCWCLMVLGQAALVAAGAPLVAVLVLLGAGSVAAALFKPCVTALVPQLVRDPAELVSANAAYSLAEAAGTVAGPLLAGALLAVAGPPVGLACLAVVPAAAAVVSLLIRTDHQPARARGASGVRVLLEPLRGFPALLAPGARLVFGVFLAQTAMRGLLNVFVVVLALTSAAGAGGATTGVLFAVIGVGGLVGALGSVGAGRGGHRARWFALGALLWGLPVLVIGLWPHPVVALVALSALGLGNALLDVNGFTLLHRLVPDHLAGRAFAAFWSATDGALALGAVLAPVLIAGLGLPGAMVVTGAALALAPVLLWPWLRRVDAHAGAHPDEVALLRGVPLLAPMSGVALERLARRVRRTDVPAGRVVVRQGEPGDLYHLIAAGRFAVDHDGAVLRELGPGQAFGEIALIDAVPRTATVTALEPSRLLSVDGESFVAAVTGHRGAERAAREVIDAMLPSVSGPPPRPGSAD